MQKFHTKIKENGLQVTGCGFHWDWPLTNAWVCVSWSGATRLSQGHLTVDRTGSCRETLRHAPTRPEHTTKDESRKKKSVLAFGSVAGLRSERKWLITFYCDGFCVKLDRIIRFKRVHNAGCIRHLLRSNWHHFVRRWSPVMSQSVTSPFEFVAIFKCPKRRR